MIPKHMLSGTCQLDQIKFIGALFEAIMKRGRGEEEREKERRKRKEESKEKES